MGAGEEVSVEFGVELHVDSDAPVSVGVVYNGDVLGSFISAGNSEF